MKESKQTRYAGMDIEEAFCVKAKHEFKMPSAHSTNFIASFSWTHFATIENRKEKKTSEQRDKHISFHNSCHILSTYTWPSQWARLHTSPQYDQMDASFFFIILIRSIKAKYAHSINIKWFFYDQSHPANFYSILHSHLHATAQRLDAIKWF